MKRILVSVFAAALVIVLLLAGMTAARKLHSMYKNVWDRLDYISESLDKLEVDSLYHKVERLHRSAFYSGESYPGDYDYGWMDSVPPYISHACGGIDQRTYTNSREALVYNYEQGHRVFEIDFNISDDGVLIASHDAGMWRDITGSDLPYTSENFNQTPIYGKYESLNCEEVIEIMAAYPDIYVVTDTKDQTLDKTMLAFSQLVFHAKKTHPEVLDRIIPQIYNEEMLSWISSIYPFRSVIFTLYATPWTPESVLNFCMNSGVRFVTMPVGMMTEEAIRLWDTLGIRVAVHTVNDKKAVSQLLDAGVDMIYTDFIMP